MKLESILQVINALRLAETCDLSDVDEEVRCRTVCTLARVELEVGLAGVEIPLETKT